MAKPTHQRGVTLVEMLITVLLIAVLSAAAAPSFQAFRSRAVVRASAETLMGFLAEARMRAVKENTEIGVDFGPTLEGLSDRVAVNADTLNNVTIEPRLGLLADPSTAGFADISLDGYSIRFGITPVGQGYVCVPDTDDIKSPGGYPPCA